MPPAPESPRALRRSESESAKSERSLSGVRNAIAEAAPGLYGVGAELFPQSCNQGFERIGIARVIVAIEVLDQLARGYDPPLMMHEISDEPILERGQGNRDAVNADPHLPGVQRDGTGFDLRGSVSS